MFRNYESGINRRNFLATSAAALAGLLAGGERVLSAQVENGGMRYRTLGKTGLKVSEIGMGTVIAAEPAVIEHAVDKGINLFHTSPGYSKGRSIEALGQAIKNMKSKRSKIILAIKGSKLGNIDEELKLLNTDYVDLYLPPMEANGLTDPRLPEMFAKLKKSGKARFCGFTNHKGMADSMEAALKLNFIEVILATYNLPNKPLLDPVLKRVKKAGIGFIAMKTRKDAPKGEETVVVRGLLENKDVDSALITLASMQDVDKWAQVSGKKMTMRERREVRGLLLALTGACASCGRCEGVCPQGIAIPDIFRFYMYATQYEQPQQEVGFEEYRALPPIKQASNCNDCGACERVCPKSVPIRSRLKESHAMLA